GERDELLEPLAERALGAEALFGGLGGERCSARLGNRGDQGLLVSGVPLHRLDQGRHEVGPALELHVDIGVALARQVARRHQPVEKPHGRHDDRQPYDRRPDLKGHFCFPRKRSLYWLEPTSLEGVMNLTNAFKGLTAALLVAVPLAVLAQADPEAIYAK